MPEANQQGSQTVSKPPAQDQRALPNPGGVANQRERRDKFFLVIAGAILTRQQGRSPSALARECKDYTDAFMAALDAPTGA